MHHRQPGEVGPQQAAHSRQALSLPGQGPGDPGPQGKADEVAKAGLEHVADPPALGKDGQARQPQNHVDHHCQGPPSGAQQ